MAELRRPGGAAEGGVLRAARISQPCVKISLGIVPQPNGKPDGVSSDALEVVSFADDRGASGRYPDSDNNEDTPELVSIRIAKKQAESVGDRQAIEQPSTVCQDSASTACFLRATQVVHPCCVLTKGSRG